MSKQEIDPTVMTNTELLQDLCEIHEHIIQLQDTVLQALNYTKANEGFLDLLIDRFEALKKLWWEQRKTLSYEEKWITRTKLADRLVALEENLDGFQAYILSTLKEIKEQPIKQKPTYTIK